MLGRSSSTQWGLFSVVFATALLLDGGCRWLAPYEVADPDGALDAGDGPADPRDGLLDVRRDGGGPTDGPAAFYDSNPNPSACEAVLGGLYRPPPSACSGRWVWESPVGQTGAPDWPMPRNTLRAVWATSGANAWAVGAAGTVLRKSGSLWSIEYVGGDVDLEAVWGASTSEVWFGGARGTQGTLVRLKNGVWQAAVLPDATARVHALWGTGPDDVWAATSKGPYHFDGGVWRITDPEGKVGALVSIAGLPNAAGVAAVSGDGHIWHYDGQAWSKATSDADFHAVAGAGGTALAAGPGGVLASYDGATGNWAPLQLPDATPSNIYALAARPDPPPSQSVTYYLARQGRIGRVEGAAPWRLGTEHDAGSYGGDFFGVTAWPGILTGNDNAIAVGEGGWIERPTVSGNPAPDVVQPGALPLRRLVVVPNGGPVLGICDNTHSEVFRLGGAFMDEPQTPPAPPQSVWAAGPKEIWMGDSFTLRFFGGVGWTDVIATGGPVGGPVVDLVGLGSGGTAEVWALTSSGTRIMYKPPSGLFAELSSPWPGWNLQRIWAYETAAASEIVAGGQGKFWRRSLGNWTELTGGTPPSGTVRSLWASENDVYAVLQAGGSEPGGLYHHQVVGGWQRLSVAAQASALRAVWGHDQQVWVVGARGTIVHFDGVAGTWQTEISGTHQSLYDVRGDASSGEVWAIGDWGTVLRRYPQP